MNTERPRFPWIWNTVRELADTNQWRRLGRQVFLWISVPGMLGCFAGVAQQWPQVAPVDLALLPLLGLTLGVSALALALGRARTETALGAVYAVSALYLTMTLATEFLDPTPSERLSEALYWTPVLFCTAFLTWELGTAARIVTLTYLALLLVTALLLPPRLASGVFTLRMAGIAVQFLLAQGVTLVMIASLAYVRQRLAQVHTLAYMDVLTGLPNRRFIEEQWPRLRRGVRSVVLFDIDHFKQINDHHGHEVGDEVLREVAALARRCGGTEALLARWGGEEFLLLLPAHDSAAAARLAEQLRAELAAHPFGPAGPVTASFGVATGDDSHTLSTCLHRADQAMYTAKEAGRNRVAQAAG